ncbi:TlpA disulfide reductase family protein [Algoriphagus sp. D3-2-R+10]|uniref:TlpA family protein disulfide reductase n=1 Tax=Algoriphagus aurantiacus TaxID=3103948 RepID=UPI002B3B46D5|nr:TlpA disulfide reductase family protein [Algoriphagus sp. D3-2-R+10]MEB2778642.1 TlpA disulfide reductase family protein [Algoriphagus sp. D3-2-R+10]
MKLQRIILVILIIGLTACSKKNDEIIINGKVTGDIPDKIEYTIPVNGTWFYGAKNSVIPDSVGNFKISMKSDVASFITLYIPKKAAAVLLVEPDKNYEVDFKLNSKNEIFKINGKNNEALTLYNLFPLPEFYVLSTSNELLKDSVLSSVSSKINILKEKEISQFKKQFEKQIITKDFYDLAELDRKYYYLALETSIVATRYNSQADSAETQNSQILKIWKKIFNQTPPTESFDIRSPWSFTLMRNYINFNQRNPNTLDLHEIENTLENDSHSYKINEAKKYLKGKALEYYYATYILSNSFNNKDNSKELIALYEKFKKEYPNSGYSNHLTALIKPIIDFHQKIEESTNNEQVKFIENYEDIDRFDELIKTQKGKKVFVDIWGTWCAPCKKEFQQKDKYSELLKSKNITTLYICEGRNSKEKVWKEMIKYFDLEGQHLLANEKLIADIVDKFGNKGSFAYPRYLLVDENGNVVNSQASYPSKTEQLEKEINENYVW